MVSKLLKMVYAAIVSKMINSPENVNMPISEQKAFLESFDNPKNDYERSYYKYKCLCKYCYDKKKILIFMYNVGALILLPFVRHKLYNNGKKNKQSDSHFDAIIENVPRLPNDDVIPEAIKQEYKDYLEISQINYFDGILQGEAEKICNKLRKYYLFHPYFRLICMFKLAQFNQYIVNYNPKAIVFYSYENEFSGPLQNHLCENNGIEFISFMHGEYMYKLFFAFQKYKTYYIWDKSYEEMFHMLKCDFDTVIYTPRKLNGIARCLPDRECDYFITYYFSNETEETAQKVHDAFEVFRKAGVKCKVRPHPRYSNIQMLEKIFKNYTVEDLKEYSLALSIEKTLYVCGLNTTVLAQAYYSGKQVVIDDISNKALYLELSEKMFPMIYRKHKLLSSVISEKLDYNETYSFFSTPEAS